MMALPPVRPRDLREVFFSASSPLTCHTNSCAVTTATLGWSLGWRRASYLVPHVNTNWGRSWSGQVGLPEHIQGQNRIIWIKAAVWGSVLTPKALKKHFNIFMKCLDFVTAYICVLWGMFFDWRWVMLTGFKVYTHCSGRDSKPKNVAVLPIILMIKLRSIRSDSDPHPDKHLHLQNEDSLP